MNESDREYNEFILKMVHKAKEMNEDFNNLSEENNVKFANEAAGFLNRYRIAANAADILNMTKNEDGDSPCKS